MRHSDLFVELGLCLRMFIVVMWNQMLLPACPWVSTQGWASQLCSLSTQDDSGRLLVYHDSLISTWYIVYCSKLHSTSYTCHVSYMRIWVNLLLCKSDVCFLHCVNNKPCIMSLQQIRTAIMRRLGLGFFRRPFCCFVTMTSIPFIHLLRVWWSFISSSRTHWC